ncbi:hypothetical protein HBH51_068880 [Parastagonospora nodorum]|nr:hypothetical protein HBH51_068880 [Parastagonospora nodorum]
MPPSKRTRIFRECKKYLKKQSKNNARYWDTSAVLHSPELCQAFERMSSSEAAEGLAEAAHRRLTNLIQHHDNQEDLADIIGAWHDAHHRGHMRQAQKDLHLILAQCKYLPEDAGERFEQIAEDADDQLRRLHDRWKTAVHCTYLDRVDAVAPKILQPRVHLRGLRYLVMADQVETALGGLHQAMLDNQGWATLPYSDDEAVVVLRMAELHGTALRSGD